MAAKEECCYIGRGELFLKKCLTDEEIADGVTSEFVSVGNAENFSFTTEVNTITKKNYISKCGGIECAYSSIDDIQVNLTLCCYKDLNIGLALSGACIEVPAIPEQPEIPGEEAGDEEFQFTWNTGDGNFFAVSPQIDCTELNDIVVEINGQDAEDDEFTCSADGVTYTGPLLDEGGPLIIIVRYTSLGTEATPAVPAQPAQKKFNLFSCTSDVYTLQYRGCNAAKGSDDSRWIVDFHQVCFEPASEFQFLTEEFGTIELVGRLLPDRSKVLSDGTTDFPSEYGSICIIDGAA